MATESGNYIAYGSNLNIPQMRIRCPGARIIGTSVIPDYEAAVQGEQEPALPHHRTEGRGQAFPGGGMEVGEDDELHLTTTRAVQFLLQGRDGATYQGHPLRQGSPPQGVRLHHVRERPSASPPPAMWRPAEAGRFRLLLDSVI